MRAATLALASCLLAPVAGCGGGAGTSSPPASHPLVVARPYDSYAPSSYDGKQAVPLVVLLHGYGAAGSLQDLLFGLSDYAEVGGFLVAEPDGTVDHQGKRFWNATDACCDNDHTNVDDVAYVNAVIDDMVYRYRVDPARIYVIGHSNGGFMSYRMACDAAPRIAAIMSLAGATWKDPTRCHPARPVAVLHVHGDADDTVPYQGTATFPSAHESVADWAGYDGCTGDLTATGDTLDLDGRIAGAETGIERYTCSASAVELWTMHGVNHIPTFRYPDWMANVWRWLSAHPRR